MATSNYLKRISADEKTQKSAANVLAEAEAKASVEQEISRLKAQGAKLQAAYEQALGATPFNVTKVFSLTAEIETNSKNLAIAEKVLSTEFSAAQ